MFLTNLHKEITYKGQVWHYAGRSLLTNCEEMSCGEVIYNYCNYPVDDGRIVGKASKVKFIQFRFKMQLRKKNNSRTSEQIKKDIFSQINSYRKKHGIK